MSLSVGSNFPDSIEFQYIPVDLSTLKQENALACAKPFPLKVDTLLSKLSTDGKLLIVSVPGAFTPTCTENHIPPYLTAAHLTALKSKNVETLIILSANDAFVLNAWAKLLLQASDITDASDKFPKIIFASDPLAKFSADNGLSLDAGGLGIRTNRYALVVDSAKKVVYHGLETKPEVNLSGYDAIVGAKL